MPWYIADMKMARLLPRTPVEWLEEIRDAMLDACDTKPFGILTGHPITDADLFHLAPLICLKFRGRKTKGPEAKRVIETALANYVANSEQHGLKSRPMLAFVLCYVGAHLALDLLSEKDADVILNYCEEHLNEG
jgi:hypothetical protein